MTRLEKLSVRGFKSIRELKDFELTSLNVLIGANGAGKSNFISLLRMLAEMLGGRLQWFVVSEGGPDALLFGGRKRTQQIDAEFKFDRGQYRFALTPIVNQLLFSWEAQDLDGISAVRRAGPGSTVPQAPGDIYAESFLSAYPEEGFPEVVGLRVFHFHDTSREAGIRNAQQARDNLRLKGDGSNLAPFLRMLWQKHPDEYKAIVETIRMVAPFFHDFIHREQVELDQRIDLEWREVTDPDTPRSTFQLSDGTLRFICLATLLLQPERLQPSTILLDEPELGLHPYAVVLLAALLQRASETKQVIVSTQSVELVNQLDPGDVIVAERQDGASTFRRLEPESLREWLEDYTLGELWKMNVVGGSPSR